MGNRLTCNYENTDKAMKFYEKYKDSFGEIVKAEMESNPEKIKYNFILTNNDEEIMEFAGGLTAGYDGKGPNRTQEILREAGFDIEEDFVVKNASFKLEK